MIANSTNLSIFISIILIWFAALESMPLLEAKEEREFIILAEKCLDNGIGYTKFGRYNKARDQLEIALGLLDEAQAYHESELWYAVWGLESFLIDKEAPFGDESQREFGDLEKVERFSRANDLKFDARFYQKRSEFNEDQEGMSDDSYSNITEWFRKYARDNEIYNEQALRQSRPIIERSRVALLKRLDFSSNESSKQFANAFMDFALQSDFEQLSGPSLLFDAEKRYEGYSRYNVFSMLVELERVEVLADALIAFKGIGLRQERDFQASSNLGLGPRGDNPPFVPHDVIDDSYDFLAAKNYLAAELELYESLFKIHESMSRAELKRSFEALETKLVDFQHAQLNEFAKPIISSMRKNNQTFLSILRGIASKYTTEERLIRSTKGMSVDDEIKFLIGQMAETLPDEHYEIEAIRMHLNQKVSHDHRWAQLKLNGADVSDLHTYIDRLKKELSKPATLMRMMEQSLVDSDLSSDQLEVIRASMFEHAKSIQAKGGLFSGIFSEIYNDLPEILLLNLDTLLQVAELYETDEDLLREIRELIDSILDLPIHLNSPSSEYWRKTSAADVTKTLTDDSAVVDFFTFESSNDSERFGAIVLLKDNTPKIVELGKTEIVSYLYSTYRDLLMSSDLTSDDFAEFEKVNKALSAELWKPVSRLLGTKIRNVFIVPDLEVHHIFFGGLIGHSGKFAIEIRNFHTLSNASDLIDITATTRSSNAIILSGIDYGVSELIDQKNAQYFDRLLNDLKGAKLEGDVVEKLLSRDVVSHVEREIGLGAKESSLKRDDLMPPRILHIASHGLLLSDLSFGGVNGHNDYRPDSIRRGVGRVGERPSKDRFIEIDTLKVNRKEPLLSAGIALSEFAKTLEAWTQGIHPPFTEDGWLSAVEASALNLEGTELVFLSACSTGYSKSVYRGEGAISLARSFQRSGAKSVIFTNWDAFDDSAARFVELFYQKYSEGKSVGKAFGEAQRSLFLEACKQSSLYDAVVNFGVFTHSFRGRF